MLFGPQLGSARLRSGGRLRRGVAACTWRPNWIDIISGASAACLAGARNEAGAGGAGRKFVFCSRGALIAPTAGGRPADVYPAASAVG